MSRTDPRSETIKALRLRLASLLEERAASLENRQTIETLLRDSERRLENCEESNLLLIQKNRAQDERIEGLRARLGDYQ